MDQTASITASGSRQRSGARGEGTIRLGPPVGFEKRAKSSSSIPTKYETIINPNPREKDGFLTRTQRFTFDENGIPGPGSYYKAHTLENNSGSIGQKGFGTGFVSKTTRFSYKPEYTGPGPGQYNSHRISAKPNLQFNKAATSAAFANKSEGLGPPLPKKSNRAHSSPGPQAYYPSAKRDGGKVQLGSGSAAKSAFKATNHERYKRQFRAWAKELPGPGTHNPVSGTWGSQEASNTAFKHTTTREGKDGSLPERRPPAMSYGAPKNAGDGPGPGAYDNHIIGSVELHSYKTVNAPGRLESAAFANIELDRFGQPRNPRAARFNPLGPGQYDGPVTSPLVGAKAYGSHLLTPDSAFNSSVTRTMPQDLNPFGKPPGPAYYKPHEKMPERPLSPRRSFHLNAKKQWMGL